LESAAQSVSPAVPVKARKKERAGRTVRTKKGDFMTESDERQRDAT
jgi:hypothetical protein